MNEKHTPEPWEAEHQHDCTGEWWTIEAATVGRLARSGVVADTLNRDHCIDPEEDAANVRRIMACVKACQGIPVDALEQGVVAELLSCLEAYVEIEEAA